MRDQQRRQGASFGVEGSLSRRADGYLFCFFGSVLKKVRGWEDRRQRYGHGR